MNKPLTATESCYRPVEELLVEALVPELATKALEYRKRIPVVEDGVSYSTAENHADALMYGFVWNLTEEGTEFWNNIHDEINELIHRAGLIESERKSHRYNGKLSESFVKRVLGHAELETELQKTKEALAVAIAERDACKREFEALKLELRDEK